MKFFTKEFYQKLNIKANYEQLMIDPRASEYNDEFYNEIYEKRKQDYLKLINSFTDYDLYRERSLQIQEILNEKKTEEEMRKEFEEFSKPYLNESDPTETINEIIQNQIIEYQEELPKEILEEIKDFRVLALNYVTEEVYNKIKQLCLDRDKYIEDIQIEYHDLFLKQFENDNLQYLKESFHDCLIIKSEFVNNDLKIKVDNRGGFTDKELIVFKNIEIILQEDNLDDSYWIEDEIYKIDNKYEVHIYYHGPRGEKYLTIRCDNIIVE